MKKFSVKFEVLTNDYTSTTGLKKDIRNLFEYDGKVKKLKIKRIRKE